MAKRKKSDHILEKLIDRDEMDVVDAAARLGCSRQHLYNIMNGKKPMSGSLMIKASEVFNVPVSVFASNPGNLDEYLRHRSARTEADFGEMYVEAGKLTQKLADKGRIPQDQVTRISLKAVEMARKAGKNTISEHLILYLADS